MVSDIIVGGVNITDKNFDFRKCIWNEKNILLKKKHVEDILKKYGVDYKVKDLTIFQTALTHDAYLDKPLKYYLDPKINSYIYHSDKSKHLSLIDEKDIEKTVPLQKLSYQNLEFVGDANIHCVLARYLYKRYHKVEDQGFMTKMRTEIEKGKTLAEISNRIGLGKYMLITRYMELNKNRTTNISVLEDVFEAFIGALSFDSSMEVFEKFLVNVIEEEFCMWTLNNSKNNYKDALMRFFHQKGWENPTYITLSCEKDTTNSGKKIYTVCVNKKESPSDNGNIFAQGIGNNKKDAEQNASKNALISNNLINENENSDSDVEFDVDDSDSDYEEI
jgi:ribonuclease-3